MKRGLKNRSSLKHLARAGAFLGAALLVLPFLASGCGSTGERPDPDSSIGSRDLLGGPPADDRVLAEVNGRPLTRSGFIERILRQFGTAKVLAGVIGQEVAFQEAERRGIVASRPEIDARVDEIMAAEAAEAGGKENLEREYSRLGLTLADVRRDHEQQIEPQIILSKLVASLRKVDDAALREYYQQTFAHTRYQTRHIAYSFRPKPGQTDEDVGRLKLEAIHKATRAVDRIREGADFATIARAESEDGVTASHGGELGAIHEDSPGIPEFMRVVFKLRDGEVSSPVENPQGGYHVFQVTAILPSESFVDCKEKIRREILEREPSVDEMKAALMALRERADVRLHDPSLGPRPSGEGKGP